MIDRRFGKLIGMYRHNGGSWACRALHPGRGGYSGAGWRGAGDFDGGEKVSKSIFSTSNKWAEYERRKKALPPMSSEEYERVIREICRELGI